MVRASSASTRSLSANGLRCGSSCTVSVTSTVPSPSTWIAPPSFTSRDWMRSASASPATYPASAWSLSQSAQSVAPQPLKIQSTAPSFPDSSTTKVGPESRSQNSEYGTSMSSTSADRCLRASAIAVGSTSMVSGSNSAAAWATADQATRASSADSGSAPSVYPSRGNAIQIRSCGDVSAGMTHPIELLIERGYRRPVDCKTNRPQDQYMTWSRSLRSGHDSSKRGCSASSCTASRATHCRLRLSGSAITGSNGRTARTTTVVYDQ